MSPIANFPPALQHLVALARTALGTDETPLQPESLDWRRFGALIDRHRLAPLLQRHASAALATACPAPVATRIGELAAQTTRRALAQALDQARLVESLAAAGIDVLTVKGLVLAQQLHGGLGGRPVGDIDLVVRRADVARADAIIQAAGFARTRPEFVLTPRQTAEYFRLKPEYEYVRPEPLLRLELLWRLEGLPEDESLWTRTVAGELAGRPMRTLDPALNASYLFQHGARHGWFRLFWLVDVARLLQSGDVDWPEVAALTARVGGRTALLQGTMLAESILGIAPPRELLPTNPERPRVAALAAEACRQIARTTDRETVVEWFRQATYRVRLQEGLRRKLAAAAPHLSSPLNWRTWPLPDRWFFLYRFASPILWLCRRISRTFSLR